MDASPLKVLCITGWCRNGSTIIGNVLNEIPEFFHVGEIHFLWKNAAGKGANSSCGCGLALTECPVWSKIYPLEMPDGVSLEDYADTVIRRQRMSVRTRHTWHILKHGISDKGPRGDAIREHAALMTRTYHAIAERMDARVVVDTTKIPGEAALLEHLEGVTPYYVHLVRDPRAVAQSWSQEKEYCYVMSSHKSTAYWHGFNLASHAITRRYPERSLFLRYEEFIADPAGTIDALLRFCGADPATNPMRGRTIDLHPNHTVTGNPDRFRTGPTIVRDRDNPWQASLPASAKLAAVTLSWPLFRRYGYRYRGTFATGPGRVEAPASPVTTGQEDSSDSVVKEKTIGSGA